MEGVLACAGWPLLPLAGVALVLLEMRGGGVLPALCPARREAASRPLKGGGGWAVAVAVASSVALEADPPPADEVTDAAAASMAGGRGEEALRGDEKGDGFGSKPNLYEGANGLRSPSDMSVGASRGERSRGDGVRLPPLLLLPPNFFSAVAFAPLVAFALPGVPRFAGLSVGPDDALLPLQLLLPSAPLVRPS